MSILDYPLEKYLQLLKEHWLDKDALVNLEISGLKDVIVQVTVEDDYYYMQSNWNEEVEKALTKYYVDQNSKLAKALK